jgi:hypothetical protein
MIEECENIIECESKLSLIIQKVKLLGEIHLSVEEVNKLGAFIKEQISENIQKCTEFLRSNTPTCLACFLIWKGILDYRDGDYWSAIKDSIGLSDPNWQVKLGEIFTDFLKSNGFPDFDVPDAHRYVTSILMHGMIPDSCLDEYFEKILIPIVNHEFSDPTDNNEIIFFLKTRRENNKSIKDIEKEIKKLKTEENQISSKLSQVRSLIKIWDYLNEIEELEKKAGNLNELASLPENPLEYINQKKLVKQNLEKEIEELEKEEKLCEQQRRKFSEQDKVVLSNSKYIKNCINILPELEQELAKLAEYKAQENSIKEQMEKFAQSIFSESWDERYALIIQNLPFDKLEDKIEALHSRRISESGIRQVYFENILKIVKRWMNYFFSHFKKREKTIQEIQIEISEILKDLPIDKRAIELPQIELIHNLKQLCDNHKIVCHLCDIRNSIERKTSEQIGRIKNVAETVGVDISNNLRCIITTMQTKLADGQRNEEKAKQAEQEIKKIENYIKELMIKKQSIVEELQAIDVRLVRFGNGNIQSGIELLEQRRDAQHKAELLRNNLMSVYPDLKSLEREKYEAQKDGKDKSYYHSEINKLDVEIEQIKQRIVDFKERLNQIPVPFPSVDEPIRRFLIYGSDTARDFLVQSVQMINHAKEKKKVPSVNEIGLQERVVTKFEEWWRKHEKEKEEVIAGEGTVQKSQDRFRSPVIYIDTAIGEIKVRFPSQRLTDKITEIYLIVNEDKPNPYKEPLRVYIQDKDLFETEEIDFSLPFPSDHYEFTLKSGSNVINSWSINGIYPDHPFMAFNYDSKKLIKGEELPKENVWILLHNRFDLEPEGIIFEEVSLYGKWKEYKCLALKIDDVSDLCLMNRQGEKTIIPISSERILEPILFGGQILKGCHSEEDDIYLGDPPSIRILIESEDEIKWWTISIIPDRNSTLAESKHYRLGDLGEILNIDANKSVCEFPLSDEKCLGKNCIGMFTVRLKNDTHHHHIDKKLHFCIVPYLKLKFDKDIYLPCEENTTRVELKLDGTEKMEFEPQSLAKIIEHKDSSFRIEITSSEHSIHGTLRYPSFKDDFISIPITIKILRLTWRLDGFPNNQFFSECNRIEEIWFGDWKEAEESLSLIVGMPPFVCGHGELSLCNSEQKSKGKITDGKARFDLLAFNDTLRKGDEPLQTFEITVPDSEPPIDNVELFKVRTRWEVEGLECIQKFYNGKLILNISWKREKGKAEGQRVVRLWKIESPDSDPFRWEVPEGTNSVEITVEQEKIPSGNYRIHIDVEDTWSITKSSMPFQDSLNTIEIQIQEEILQGQINILSIIDNENQTYSLKGRYIIDIEGKIISGKLPVIHNNIVVKEGTNEGWYMGNISVNENMKINDVIDQVNPVKFQYAPKKRYIESIEDKEGDGVYFCILCKELFWDEKEHEKEHEKNFLFGNFKLKINNKS